MALELLLSLRTVEGALLRTLGLIERRGFALGAVQARSAAERTSLRVEVEPNGRSVEVLLRQLGKLHDVLEATLELAPRPHPIPARALRGAAGSRRVFPGAAPAFARGDHP